MSLRNPDAIEEVLILEEPVVPQSKYIHIPELSMRIKLKNGQTLQNWVKMYCRDNAHLIPVLYPIYMK